jgi:hypothetical protein
MSGFFDRMADKFTNGFNKAMGGVDRAFAQHFDATISIFDLANTHGALPAGSYRVEAQVNHATFSTEPQAIGPDGFARYGVSFRFSHVTATDWLEVSVFHIDSARIVGNFKVGLGQYAMPSGAEASGAFSVHAPKASTVVVGTVNMRVQASPIGGSGGGTTIVSTQAAAPAPQPIGMSPDGRTVMYATPAAPGYAAPGPAPTAAPVAAPSGAATAVSAAPTAAQAPAAAFGGGGMYPAVSGGGAPPAGVAPSAAYYGVGAPMTASPYTGGKVL